MRVLDLCHQFNINIPFNLGAKLGDGANGEVFDLTDQFDKVVKLSVLSECDNHIWSAVKLISDHLVNHHDAAYVRVYVHEYLGEIKNTILHYYIMEKLLKISEDEKKVFHSILSHEDNNIEKKYSILKIKNMLLGMQRGLDFNFEKIILFCENVFKSNIKHNDIHYRNIMKDHNGNFKLVDLDSCKLKG